MAPPAWLAGLFALGVWQRAFRCPRCGKRFHGNRTRLARVFCTNCGLPRDSYSPTDVSPDFVEWKRWNP